MENTDSTERPEMFLIAQRRNENITLAADKPLGLEESEKKITTLQLEDDSNYILLKMVYETKREFTIIKTEY